MSSKSKGPSSSSSSAATSSSASPPSNRSDLFDKDYDELLQKARANGEATLGKYKCKNDNSTDAMELLVIGSGYGGAVAAFRATSEGVETHVFEMGQLWVKEDNNKGDTGTDTNEDAAASSKKVFCSMTHPDERAVWGPKGTKIELPIDQFSFFRTEFFANCRLRRRLQGLFRKRGCAGVLQVECLFADNSRVPINIYQGRGVGGGSLVNGGMAPSPFDKPFDREFRSLILRGTGPKADAAAFIDGVEKKISTARRNLGVTTKKNDAPRTGVPSSVYNSDYYTFSRKTAEKIRNVAGGSKITIIDVPNVYDMEYMHKELQNQVVRSALSDEPELVYGNNAGKQSVDKTYLATAASTGRLMLHPLHKVLKVGATADDELYIVTVQPLDNHAQPNGCAFDVRAKSVIFAAGALCTTRLLLESKRKGLTLSSEIGKHFGNNGNLHVALEGSVSTGKRQSVIPADGIWDAATRLFAEIVPFPAPLEHKNSVFLAVTSTTVRGTLSLSAPDEATSTTKAVPQDATTPEADPVVSLRWEVPVGVEWFDESISQAATTFEKLVGKGSDFKYKGLFTEHSGLARKGKSAHKKHIWGVDSCFHPLGGCVLGHATTARGELLKADDKPDAHRGLFVVDGSLLPGRLGVNPLLTITAMAEHLMDAIVDIVKQRSGTVVSDDNHDTNHDDSSGDPDDKRKATDRRPRRRRKDAKKKKDKAHRHAHSDADAGEKK